MKFGEIKEYWKPLLFVSFVTTLSFISAKHGRVYSDVLEDNTTAVTHSLQDSACGNNSITTRSEINSFVCKAQKANRSYNRAKGSYIFNFNYSINSPWQAIDRRNARHFLPGLDSMDKYLTLPPLVNANTRALKNEAWQRRDYRLLISHNATCSSLQHNKSKSSFDFEKEVFLLVTLKSKCSNEVRRQAIRRTWGNENWIFKNLNVRAKIIFMLGKCETSQETSKILKESELNKDILQWDFVDNFRNLTLKQFLLWQWYGSHCMDVPFLFQGDDDILGNIVNIVNKLLSVQSEHEADLWIGSELANQPPVRDPTSRYYVSKSLYPKKKYPLYVSGGGYLISGCLVIRVFLESLKTRIIQIDDAFLGVLTHAVGVAPTHDPGFASWGLADPTAKNISEVTTFHRTLPLRMMAMWEDLMDYYTAYEGKVPETTPTTIRYTVRSVQRHRHGFFHRHTW